MAFGEPQLQDWDVTYKLKLFHTESNGYIEIMSGTQVDPRDELASQAVQAALDVLTSNGFTLDQAFRSCIAAQVITPTEPPE